MDAPTPLDPDPMTQRSISRRLALTGLAGMLVLAAGGCGPTNPLICHHGIDYEVSPEEAFLSVGESVTPTAYIVTCPRGREEIALHWQAEDASLVEVDATSGRITGRAPGETRVHGTGGEENGLPIVTIQVIVEG